ncbi:MAG: phosphosulfolactate synthase [Streptosporangiaceae bacterium]
MTHRDFLDLPARSAKPRGVGITHVLDGGLPAAEAPALLETSGDCVDVWKLGWGTAYLDPGLDAKLKLLADHRVLACPGGTLLEIAWAQGRTEAFLDWAAESGFPCVEVSAGTVPMSRGDKERLITAAADRFIVLAEVGMKRPEASLTPHQWADAATRDLAAGATWVLTEGRESGTVGTYAATGAVRGDVVEAVVDAASIDCVVFEAPRKDQQAWFVKRYGPDVNLANVRPAEALGLETLRLGLRADTFGVGQTTTRPWCGIGDHVGERR